MTEPRTRHDMARSGKGFFAIGICSGKTPQNLGTLWRQAFLYEAAFVFMVGARYQRQSSDTPNTARHIPLMHFRDIDDLHSHLPYSCPLVGVELDDRSIPLRSFNHPRVACYLLGAEDHGLAPVQRDSCHQLVQIESPLPWSMNVAVAGSLLLYDRYCQTLALRAVA